LGDGRWAMGDGLRGSVAYTVGTRRLYSVWYNWRQLAGGKPDAAESGARDGRAAAGGASGCAQDTRYTTSPPPASAGERPVDRAGLRRNRRRTDDPEQRRADRP